jgi:2-methylisocitrate lyase-like PEP mutase family enzyme
MYQVERARTLRRWITKGETFVLPEAWDVASARMLGEAGCQCIGTSAAAIRWANGYRPHEHVQIEDLLLVAARIVRGCALPVNADIDCRGGAGAEEMQRAVAAALTVGCAGVTVGDASRNGVYAMIPIEDMQARLKAARAACAEAGVRAVVTARTDAFVFGPSAGSPFETAVERAEAYFEAGADCVLVPGAEHLQVVERLVSVIGGPLAIAVSQASAPHLRDYAEAGVACVTLGSSLFRTLLGTLRRKTETLLAFGDFTSLDQAIPAEEMETLMGSGT